MANLNEYDAINQVKRGSLEFTVGQKFISNNKKEFIEAKSLDRLSGRNRKEKGNKTFIFPWFRKPSRG